MSKAYAARIKVRTGPDRHDYELHDAEGFVADRDHFTQVALRHGVLVGDTWHAPHTIDSVQFKPRGAISVVETARTQAFGKRHTNIDPRNSDPRYRWNVGLDQLARS